jgi:hypothetical protein
VLLRDASALAAHCSAQHSDGEWRAAGAEVAAACSKYQGAADPAALGLLAASQNRLFACTDQRGVARSLTAALAAA